MAETKCPLCSRDATAEILERFDAHRVRCETCGEFDISDVAGLGNYTDKDGVRVSEFRYMFSALTRQAWDSGKRIFITRDNISELWYSMRVPTPLDCLDRSLLFIGDSQTKADHEFQVVYADDYPKAFAKDAGEFHYFLDALADRNLLHRRGEANTNHKDGFYRLTPEGWAKAGQIKSIQIASDQAFVAMWFDKELMNAWEQGFEPALNTTGFKPLRVDLAEYNGKIDDFIIAQIRRSGLLVADFTGHRGGVYFEAGFAMGLGIPCILTCRDTDVEKLHFDTRQYNHIIWETPQDLKEKLQNRIGATILPRPRNR